MGEPYGVQPVDPGDPAPEVGAIASSAPPLTVTPVATVGHMGFNPNRPTRADRRSADLLFVAAALVVCAATVLWAVFG